MAATKRRDVQHPQADFDMLLSEALALLLDANDVLPNDRWHFQVDGDFLKITRSRAPIDRGNGPPDLVAAAAVNRKA